jgi:DnaK suppressor protein
MLMTKAEIKKIKGILETERERVENELSGIAHRNPQAKETAYETDYKDIGDDSDENATEIAQYTNDLSVESELEKLLRDIEKALFMIEEGSYGSCKYCGDKIAVKRLEIRPTSSSCIACKKTFTKEA